MRSKTSFLLFLLWPLVSAQSAQAVDCYQIFITYSSPDTGKMTSNGDLILGEGQFGTVRRAGDRVIKSYDQGYDFMETFGRDHDLHAQNFLRAVVEASENPEEIHIARYKIEGDLQPNEVEIESFVGRNALSVLNDIHSMFHKPDFQEVLDAKIETLYHMAISYIEKRPKQFQLIEQEITEIHTIKNAHIRLLDLEEKRQIDININSESFLVVPNDETREVRFVLIDPT